MAFRRRAALISPSRDRRASVEDSFDWFVALPRGIRRASVASLGAFADGIVLDVGCGAGRDFQYLEEAGGPTCRIVGIDISAESLAQAADRCTRHGWSNVALVRGDALVAPMPDVIAGAIFSLSYASMERRREILARVWERIRPGGRIVVMDAKAPPGNISGLVTTPLPQLSPPGGSAVSVAPWADLASLGATVARQEWAFGSYFIAVGTKPQTVKT